MLLHVMNSESNWLKALSDMGNENELLHAEAVHTFLSISVSESNSSGSPHLPFQTPLVSLSA